MTSINSTSNIAFKRNNSKKTPRGNEYEVTHLYRTTGGAVGLLSGALVSHMASKRASTISGKRDFIQALHNVGKGPEIFGPVGQRKGYIKGGLVALCTGLSLLGMFVGAAIGGTIDSHNNQKRAKIADETANR